MRNHSGGFIAESFYWDIGDEERGRDGMNAREAARRYNDHRHPALSAEDANEALLWMNEVQQASYHTADGAQRGTQGGIIEDDPTASLRRVGDLMHYRGLVWMYAGVDLGPVPLGVGAGCDINRQTGEFTRGVDYRSLQIATSTLVDHTDEPIQGFGAPLGERVCAYTLIPKNFSSSRTRPYMFIRVTASINDSPNFRGDIVEAFPLRARILIMTQDANELPGQSGSFIGGILRFAPVYDPANNQSVDNVSDLATINLRHTLQGQISVVDSNPLALDLDLARYFLQINADVHVYTEDEVTQYNNANGTAFTHQDVLEATECELNIFSITLESESYLGLSPFINDQNLRYTIPQRPQDA
ncbi:MAG: hypothetical protein VXZ72_01770 [Chlamydiota bacterium]|nr:hypothetical protein [Chlamydiota bacterium]